MKLIPDVVVVKNFVAIIFTLADFVKINVWHVNDNVKDVVWEKFL